jgi:hypothetical protein
VKSTHLNAFETQDVELVEWKICWIRHNQKRMSLLDNNWFLKQDNLTPQYAHHTEGSNGNHRSSKSVFHKLKATINRKALL